MKRRDLFTLAGGGVAAFLVSKYGPPSVMVEFAVTRDAPEIAEPGTGALMQWEYMPGSTTWNDRALAMRLHHADPDPA